MRTAQEEVPTSTFWDEYWQLPAHKHVEGWWVYSNGDWRRRSYWFCIWDWPKKQAYKQWLERWGLR